MILHTLASKSARMCSATGYHPVAPQLLIQPTQEAYMSAKIIAEVLLHSKAIGASKLLLVTLAHHANDEGTNAYPSMKTLALLCGYSLQYTQALIKSLEHARHLTVERQKAPGHNARNIYTLARPWNAYTYEHATTPAVPAQKSMQLDGPLNKPKEREKPRACPREVLDFEITPGKALWLGLEPESPFAAVCLHGAGEL